MKKEEIIEKFDEIIESKGLMKSDINDIFEAMSEILEFVSDELERNEPYATISITQFRDVSREIWEPDMLADNIVTDD